ncbi:hypothetical protein R3I94_013850 [Phoxinus phoxinus]
MKRQQQMTLMSSWMKKKKGDSTDEVELLQNREGETGRSSSSTMLQRADEVKLLKDREGETGRSSSEFQVCSV